MLHYLGMILFWMLAFIAIWAMSPIACMFLLAVGLISLNKRPKKKH